MKSKIEETKNINRIRRMLRTAYCNKYYNMFMHEFKWGGLEFEQQDFIMRKFWDIGTVACFKIKHTEDLAFTGYAPFRYNIYDFPEKVTLINTKAVPFIPSDVMDVNENVVLGWIQANHRGIKEIVDTYIDRMVEVDMVINTNLNTHKLPFVVPISPTDAKKAQDIVNKILNNELVVFLDFDQVNLVNALSTNTPYIIDKLYQYKTSLENELLTYLGIDNAQLDSTRDRLIVDEVNANNAVINANQLSMLENLQNFCDKISEVLGVTVTVEPTQKPVESVHEDEVSGGEEDVNESI